MTLFLTVDAGGTSTRAVLHDAAGVCRGYAVGSGGNPTASGVETVANIMRSVAERALQQADADPAQVEYALAAMAGSAPGQKQTGVERGLEELGIPAGLELGSDLQAMFFAGTAALAGTALVSGTGAAAIVVRDGVTTARSDGRGWLLGDVGSGYWIARRIVRAVTEDLDGRGPRTDLTEALLPAIGIPGDRSTGAEKLLDDLVTAAYAIPTPGIARFAPLAFELVATDEVARSIVQDAGRGLADTVSALDSPDQSAPLVVGGSVLFHQTALREQVTALLRERGWSAPVTPVADGTLGAISMNLRSAGIAVDATLHKRIALSLNEIRERVS